MLFILVLFIIVMSFIILVVIGAVNAKKKKEFLDSLTNDIDLSLEKEHFKKIIKIKCDYCGNIFEINNKTCPNCGGAYESNKEYIQMKKEMNKQYLNYLNNYEKLIVQQEEKIKEIKKILKKNLIMKRSFYNVEYPKEKYISKNSFSFNCEYCGTLINDINNKEKRCAHCGASYLDNSELIVVKEEDKIEKMIYEKNIKLNIEIDTINNINEHVDYRITKYAKPLALVILLVMFGLVGIIVFILKGVFNL